jgi:hypothetical protein
MRRLLLCSLGALVLPTLVAGLSGACNNNVIVPDDDDGLGGQGGEGASPPTSTGPGGKKDAGADALSEYNEQPCEDPPPPLEDFACDPYAQGNGDCAPGEGCYIYVDYPPEPCGQEIYGSLCMPAGIGQQGDPCNGAQDCGGGLVCVVTGSGTQCVQLCELDQIGVCPSGLICEPIDVEGFGGCL